MDNTIEEIFLSKGWPSEVIEKLKQIFDIIDLKKLCHVYYNTFSNYISKYSFLDLETAAKIFMSDLQGIDLNIFEENVYFFINLLKRDRRDLINIILKFLGRRYQNHISLVNQILPIIENLNQEELHKLVLLVDEIDKHDIVFLELNTQDILSILKTIDSNSIDNFLTMLILDDFNVQRTLDIFEGLSFTKTNWLTEMVMRYDLNPYDLKKSLLKISDEYLSRSNLIQYIDRIEILEYVFNNIDKIKSIESFEDFLSIKGCQDSNHFIIYFNLFIKYSFERDIGETLMELDDISGYTLNSFEEYDYYLSNFNEDEIDDAFQVSNLIPYLPANNYFELLKNFPIEENNHLYERLAKIETCHQITVEEAKFLNECDENFFNNVIVPFFGFFIFYCLSFSDFIFANNSLKLENNTKEENLLIFQTIDNIFSICKINFRKICKLYKQGFNDFDTINKIKMNFVTNSISEFKSIYYMIDKMDENTIKYFSHYLKEGIDFFDALELAKLKQKEGSVEEKDLEKNWYYLKIKKPEIFDGIKQTEENLSDTAILYKNIIENYRRDMAYDDFIEIRDIYFQQDIPLYDFIESYYQYSESNLDYSFFIFLNEKYGLRAEDLTEKMKVIDQNLIEVEEYTGESYKLSRILNQGWGDSEKLINTLYRYSRSSSFDKNLFPILFNNPILIGMNSSQIKNILEEIQKKYGINKKYFDINSEDIKDSIKAYSVFKNPNILSQYTPHDLAQNIPDNLPYYELKVIEPFLTKYVKHKNPKVKCVAYNWNKIPDNLKIKNDVEEMFNYLIDSKIIDENKSLIAMECDLWNISGEKFEEVEQIFAKSLKTPMPKWSKIPLIKGEYGFTGRFLPRNDPRGLFIGNYTDCCQKIGGAGEVVAIHSQTSPNAAIFVIEYQDNIIAQSWVFNDENGNIIFDNIEKDFSGLKFKFEDLIRIIVNIYKEAAAVIKKLGYNNVLLGANQYGITPENYKGLGLEEAKGFEGAVATDYTKLIIYPPDSYNYKLRLAMISNKIDKIASDISDKIEKVINNG